MRLSSLGLALTATLCLATPGHARSLGLSMKGGGAGQLTTFQMTGTPGTPYLLLYDFAEVSTPLSPTMTLDISLQFLPVAITIPGFLGTFPQSGTASASFIIPSADPALLDATVSFQALGGKFVGEVSKLIRLTPALPGTFESTLGAPAILVAGGAIADLPDGSVLLVGGSGPVAQTYDPCREEFTTGGAAFGVGLLGQSTALADGRFLFSGGLGLDGQPTSAAAVYDPASGQTQTLAMNTARAGHGASLLPNGKVLITGGFKTFDLTDILALFQGVQNTTEFFDPATMTFTSGPVMLEPRALHTSTRAGSAGNLLVAGGLTLIPIVNLPNVSNTAYEYSASTNSFGLPKFFSGARMLHSATRLSDGRVLMVGGISLDLAAVLQSGDITQLQVSTLADGQLYSSGFFGGFQAAQGALSTGRAGAGLVTLGDGSVLVAGGVTASFSASQFDFSALSSADRFSPSGGFTVTGSLASPRFLPILHPLQDGTILTIGGGPQSAEVYQP